MYTGGYFFRGHSVVSLLTYYEQMNKQLLRCFDTVGCVTRRVLTYLLTYPDLKKNHAPAVCKDFFLELKDLSA